MCAGTLIRMAFRMPTSRHSRYWHWPVVCLFGVIFLVGLSPTTAEGAPRLKKPTLSWTRADLQPWSSYTLSRFIRTNSQGPLKWTSKGSCTTTTKAVKTKSVGVCTITVSVKRTARHSAMRRSRTFLVHGSPAITVPLSTTVANTVTKTTTPLTTTPQTTASQTTLPKTTVPVNTTDFEAEVLRLTNIERTNAGLSPVAECNTLAVAARAHSTRMLDGQFFAHTDPASNKKAVDRIRDIGYLDGANGWSVGENIAMGQSTPDAVMTSWMNSPGHRANILSPAFTHLGVGVVVGAFQEWKSKYSNWDAVPFSTQNFGHGGICE